MNRKLAIVQSVFLYKQWWSYINSVGLIPTWPFRNKINYDAIDLIAYFPNTEQINQSEITFLFLLANITYLAKLQILLYSSMNRWKLCMSFMNTSVTRILAYCTICNILLSANRNLLFHFHIVYSSENWVKPILSCFPLL